MEDGLAETKCFPSTLWASVKSTPASIPAGETVVVFFTVVKEQGSSKYS